MRSSRHNSGRSKKRFSGVDAMELVDPADLLGHMSCDLDSAVSDRGGGQGTDKQAQMDAFMQILNLPPMLPGDYSEISKVLRSQLCDPNPSVVMAASNIITTLIIGSSNFVFGGKLPNAIDSDIHDQRRPL